METQCHKGGTAGPTQSPVGVESRRPIESSPDMGLRARQSPRHPAAGLPPATGWLLRHGCSCLHPDPQEGCRLLPCSSRLIQRNWGFLMARRHKKAFFSDQCKEIEEINRMGKTRDLFREGNGIPLQYSCLENPMDGGAWKAAVHGVSEGQT